jgi:hypothetical protein
MKPMLALLLAATLAACGGSARYADVARFHANQPINRGTLYIQPADPAVANSLEFRTHAETIATEMRRLGFQTVPDASQAQYLATVDVFQSDGATTTRAGSTTASAAGPGPSASGRRVTTVSVQLKRASDNAVLWEGRANTEAPAGTPEATFTWAVPKLASALFQDFPGIPGQTIRVTL